MSHDPDRHYYSPATSQLLKSLTKLEHARQLQYLATQIDHHTDTPGKAHPSGKVGGKDTGSSSSGSSSAVQEGEGEQQVNNSTVTTPNIILSGAVSGAYDSTDTHTHHSDAPLRDPRPDSLKDPIKSRLPPIQPTRIKDAVLNRPLIIIIRHGKTEHNKLGLFTGKGRT